MFHNAGYIMIGTIYFSDDGGAVLDTLSATIAGCRKNNM